MTIRIQKGQRSVAKDTSFGFPGHRLGKRRPPRGELPPFCPECARREFRLEGARPGSKPILDPRGEGKRGRSGPTPAASSASQLVDGLLPAVQSRKFPTPPASICREGRDIPIRGGALAAWRRQLDRPVSGTLVAAVSGVVLTAVDAVGDHFALSGLRRHHRRCACSRGRDRPRHPAGAQSAGRAQLLGGMTRKGSRRACGSCVTNRGLS